MPAPNHEDLLTVRVNALSAAIAAQAARKVAPLGLDQRMIAVLFALDQLERPSQQRIVTETGIDRTTVSKTIDRLEADGLVKRHVDPRHRRRNWIEATPKSVRTLARVRQLFRECDAEYVSVLSAGERRQLSRLLDKLEKAPR